MSVWKVCLAATVAGVIFMAPPAAAKQEKEEKSEWTFYGDRKNEGFIPGEVHLLKEKKKIWKAAGKPYYDPNASPKPFAVLLNHDGYLEYLDGKRAYADVPLKVKPGVHSLVVSLNGPGVISKDSYEFKIHCEAGREYLLKATWKDPLFRRGRWAPYVIWRTMPPGYPKERQARK